MLASLARLNRPVVAIVAVAAIAAAVRFTNLEYPQKRIFDEYYYSKSACIFLGYSNERCDINSGDERYWRRERNDTGAWVHPPLGKWMIAAGELAFGTGSFGWRFSAAVTGTATVVLLAVIVQLLFGSAIWTFTGGLLLALENLHVVQSRTAMLDVFVTFWIVLGFLFLLMDRRWIDRRAPSAPEPEDGPGREDAAPASAAFVAPLWRPSRFGAGAALGAGMATKWSAATAIAVAMVLAILWEMTRRRHAGRRGPVLETLAAEGFGVVLAFLVVPALVYVATYVGWFAHFGWTLGGWARLQSAIFDYHANLQVTDPATGEPVHASLSEAWKWILLWRPVLYYADYTTEGIRKVIYANGNPAIFWGSIAAVPWTAFAWWRSRDWRAGFVVVGALGLYLPWFLVRRPQFLFYATPLSPFFVLACVYALRRLAEVKVRRSTPGSETATPLRPWLPVVVGLVLTAVGLFVWFWPTLTGGPVSEEAFRLRTWFPSWV